MEVCLFGVLLFIRSSGELLEMTTTEGKYLFADKHIACAINFINETNEPCHEKENAGISNSFGAVGQTHAELW